MVVRPGSVEARSEAYSSCQGPEAVVRCGGGPSAEALWLEVVPVAPVAGIPTDRGATGIGHPVEEVAGHSIRSEPVDKLPRHSFAAEGAVGNKAALEAVAVPSSCSLGEGRSWVVVGAAVGTAPLPKEGVVQADDSRPAA